MNIKRHKEDSCSVIYSIKDREPIEIDFENNCGNVKGVTKFVIHFLVKPTNNKEITENIPKN